MNRKRLPHFLIIGAPKCGTTALHNYLSQHPVVYDLLNYLVHLMHFYGQNHGLIPSRLKARLRPHPAKGRGAYQSLKYIPREIG